MATRKKTRYLPLVDNGENLLVPERDADGNRVVFNKVDAANRYCKAKGITHIIRHREVVDTLKVK